MTVPFARAGLALALATALGGCATLAPQPRGDDITPLLEARGRRPGGGLGRAGGPQ